jgi:hypothetical protein
VPSASSDAPDRQLRVGHRPLDDGAELTGHPNRWETIMEPSTRSRARWITERFRRNSPRLGSWPDQRDAALSCRPLYQNADVDTSGATDGHDLRLARPNTSNGPMTSTP